MRLRFSPVSVVGVLAILGVSYGWWNSIRRHQEFLARNQDVLKEWLEPLDVEDPSQVAYRLLPPRNVGFHQWRIYLPPGRRYEIRCATVNSGLPGFSSPYSIVARTPITPGQSLVEVEWRQDVESKPQLDFAILPPNGLSTLRTRVEFPPEFVECFARSRLVDENYLGGETGRAPSRSGRVELVTVRQDCTPAGGLPPGTQRWLVGFKVWVQPYDVPDAKPIGP